MTARRWLILSPIVIVGLVIADPMAMWWGNRSPSDEAARLAALAGVAPAQVVAEIGAGGGEMARVMAPKLLPGGRLILTELDDARLDDLRAMVASEQWRHVEVRRGDIAGTALEASCCALIYMRHVFHHFESPAAMARALYEAVAPGGRLSVIDFPPHWWLDLLAPVAREGTEDDDAHGITVDTLIRHLTAAGFTVERTESDWTSSSFMVMARK